ncbi:MAG: hypothetical protein WBA93_19315 [Microcoleaceae cyanobacterium]
MRSKRKHELALPTAPLTDSFVLIYNYSTGHDINPIKVTIKAQLRGAFPSKKQLMLKATELKNKTGRN